MCESGLRFRLATWPLLVFLLHGAIPLLTQAWGEYDSWSKDNLMDAGTILAGMSPDELHYMRPIDLDVLESLGGYEIFSQEQVNRTIFVGFL